MEENNMRPTKQPGIYCFDPHGLGLECFFQKTQKQTRIAHDCRTLQALRAAAAQGLTVRMTATPPEEARPAGEHGERGREEDR